MANKKTESIENISAEVVPIDELAQLRTIVFGAAEHKLSEQITTLRTDMEQSITSLEHCLTKKITEFQHSADLKFTEIEDRLSFIDKTHDNNEENIQKSLDNLFSEHDLFDSATQQDLNEMSQSLGNVSHNLTLNFDLQLKELKTHLEKVSKELSSSKTDRKTLAKLLATMATNLEDDEL
jgi:hypothetical protein